MTGTPVPALLDVRDLVVTFGGVRAVDGASLKVPDEGIVGLIGPNGAGKTTLIDAVSGFVPVSNGSITFADEVITTRAAHRRARRNLSRTFQSLELFEDLTVAENVQVSTEATHWWRNLGEVFRIGVGGERADVDWALDQLELTSVADRVPGELSQAERKYLALARGIAARPRLLMLDEPAAGLDHAGTEELGSRLQRLAAEGIALLLVDHDMSLVLEVCNQVYVLDTGRVIASGPPAEVRRNPEVLRSYLGEDESVISTTEPAEDQ